MTLAERLIVTDMLVIRNATWLAVPKYKGTKANQITHVVYIVKPIKVALNFAKAIKKLKFNYLYVWIR